MKKLALVLCTFALALASAGDASAQARGPRLGAGPRSGLRATVPLVEKTPVARCTVTEILATTEKKGLDPKLERLRAKLTRPPFSAWDTFRLVGEPGAAAEKDRPAAVKLATGGTLTLLFKDKLVTQGGKPRLRFGLDVDSKSGKRTVSTVVVFDDGDSVLIAGEPFQSGTYIMALSCSSR